MSIESSMTDSDWEDIKESEFYNIAEGVSSFAVIFKHDDIGLHGFQVKQTGEGAILEPKSFSKQSEENLDESTGDAEGE